MSLRVADLEVLFTANTKDIAAAQKQVLQTGKAVESKPITQKVDANVSPLEAAMDRAEQAGVRMSKELVEGFLTSDRAAKMSADEIQRVLVKSYGVAEDAAEDLARAAKAPITIKADAKSALAAMDRVEADAKTLVSRATIVRVDADIARAEKNLATTEDKLEHLRTLAAGGLDVAADIKRAEAQLQKVQRHLDGLRTARNTIDVDADTADALAELDKVQAAGKRIVSEELVARVDADIKRAQASVTRFEADLEVLRSKTPTVQVLADIDKAEARLKAARGRLDDLEGARATMEVDADTSGAEAAFDDLSDDAAKTGDDAGEGLAGGIIGALAAIPVAGAVVGIGKAIGDSLISGFQQALGADAGRDRLAALTGLDEAAAIRVANAAGEAYANNFGESIEANMDTARLALQFDIIDETATTRDAQKVVEGLAGIADVLGEDVRPVAQAVTTMLSTGVARSAEHAFDILATGARNGVNRSEDLLDTFTEYPALFARLGLSGEEAMGLLNQGLEAGARNSDLAADALKEFQIRATDASQLSAQSFEALGLNAEEMTAKIAGGGAGAREGLDQVLDGLRAMEDPVARNAVAVGLFGTQAEDLGEALFNMDLSTAVEELGQVTDAAQTMFDTLASNDASKLETARRNVEVAMQGIQAALATALSEPLGDAADWITRNRGPLLQFFSDLVNGAFDFAAGASTAFAEFVSGPLAAMMEGLASLIDFVNGPFEGRPKEIDDMAEAMRGFDDDTALAVETLEDMRDKFNGFADGQIALGYLNDAALRTADAIAKVGTTTDGTTASQELLEQQVDEAVKAYEDEIRAAEEAGESQDNLKARYDSTREALKQQLVQMGLTEAEADALIDTYMRTPEEVGTEFTTNARAARGDVDGLTGAIGRVPRRPEGTRLSSNARAVRGDVDGLSRAIGAVPRSKGTNLSSNANRVRGDVDGLARRIGSLPNKTVRVGANTVPADDAMRNFRNRWSRHEVTIIGRQARGNATGNIIDFVGNASGNIIEFMATGGLTPMQPLAQMVSPSTWRVVGDRGDVSELYAPLDGSARSWNLLLEGLRRMPGSPPGGSSDGVRGGLSIGTLVLGHGGPKDLFDELEFRQGM